MHARFATRPASLTCAILAAAVVMPGPAHAATTRAEYVAQADPICAAANADIAGLNKRFLRLHKKGRYGAAGAALRKTGTRLSVSLAQVRAIAAPPGDEATVTSWLGLIDDVAAVNRRMGRAEAKQRFGKVVKLINRNAQLHDQAHTLVADWGFQSCA
jgi:hypothetical protein